MKVSVLSFPWLSISCVGLAYGLLGWELSALSALWVVDLWLVTVCVIFLLIWRGQVVSRWIRSGPRSLVTILMLSLVVNLAFSYSQPFGLALILLLTIFLGRLELQSKGLNRRVVLVILSVVAGGALTTGWCLGHSPMLIELWQNAPRWQ